MTGRAAAGGWSVSFDNDRAYMIALTAEATAGGICADTTSGTFFREKKVADHAIE
jgi:hypothetical protein